MKRLRVGIIGQGRSGYDIHAKTLKNIVPDRFEIVAVTDPLSERCDQAKSELGCEASMDYRQLLGRGDIDLVVNASPSHLHVPITMEALDAGFDVLCEKPLARKAAEVDRLMAKAKKMGRVLAIFQQSRFAPYFQQVRSVIQSGVLGRVVMVKIGFNGFSRRWDWQTSQAFNGGSLLNTGPHPLDQALQLFGTDVMPRVFCLMDRTMTFGDAEDHVKLILSGPGRPTIDLEISSCCAYPLYTYHVDATQGGLTGTTDHLEWKYFTPEEAPTQTLILEPLPNRAWCTEQLTWHTGAWDFPKDGPGLFDVMAKSFYENLHAAITEGAPLAVQPREVRQQIAVIEECHRQNPLPRRF